MKSLLHLSKKTLLPPYQMKEVPVLAAVLFILVGLVISIAALNPSTTLQSNASSASSIEPETGTLAGDAATGNDSSTSGGQYVRLGSALPPVTPIPTSSGPALYVSTTGSDTNPGTQAAPFKTLQKAANVATAGTTIHVAPGSYVGLLRSTVAGTATARIRFVSDTKWGAKISATTGIPVTLTGAYTDFEGFDVAGSTSGNGIIELEGNYTRAIGNFVHNLPIGCSSSNGGAGINATGWINGGYNGHHQEIIGNLVQDVGTGPRDGSCSLVHGIYAAVPYVKIVNNVVRRSTGSGIHAWHAATNHIIVNNTTVDNGGNGIIIGNGDSGGSSAGNHDSYVANNIAVKNAAWAITECCDATVHGPNYYVNNLSWNNRYNGVGNIMRGGTQTGSVTADPLFVNFAGDDYHVQPGSPAIDTGTSTNAPATDIEGITRPQGATVDRGAYER